MKQDDIVTSSLKEKTFAEEEDGAVTVDWIVLTAGIVGVAALSAISIREAVTSLSSTVGTAVSGTVVSNGNE